MTKSKNKPPILTPWDKHNQQLASHVHPADWKNPAPASRYNLVIIGAGPIGCEMAQSFARFGSEVILIETVHGILPREENDDSGFKRATPIIYAAGDIFPEKDAPREISLRHLFQY
ncbi:MAG: FAD-dependent oxidoreductase [Pseudomonadota bacterium]